MHDKLDTIGETGLQFFGKITASVSHEIKNVLAIINENAGLLEDFTLMADRGKPIDPARLKTMAAAVKKQISRADDIVKRMNRFAHSTDEAIRTIDLNDALELIVALSNRFASMRSVTLELKLQESPVKVKTFPFFLMNLLWLCLDFAMEATGNGKIVELVTQKTETGAQIRFGRLEGLAKAPLDTFPAERERNLLNMLRADLVVNAENNEFVVKLPGDISRD
jgi:C4-dicarboxylate-specific signal transduction histidine kinase